MAVRKRSKVRSRASKPKVSKPSLTLKEMIDRIPNTEWVSTKQVCHIFNDCHRVSVYRYVAAGLLTPHRAKGNKASYYPREEVEQLVKAKFYPKPKIKSPKNDASNRKSAKKKTKKSQVRKKKSNSN